MDTITATHDGIVITYDEVENRWRFELRGRNRSTESLAKAKEYIDKPTPDDKEKPFERRKAWWWKWNVVAEVEITSIAERGYRGTEVWIMNGDRRSKEQAKDFFPQDEITNKQVDAWNTLQSKIEVHEKSKEALEQKQRELSGNAVGESDGALRNGDQGSRSRVGVA